MTVYHPSPEEKQYTLRILIRSIRSFLYNHTKTQQKRPMLGTRFAVALRVQSPCGTGSCAAPHGPRAPNTQHKHLLQPHSSQRECCLLVLTVKGFYRAGPNCSFLSYSFLSTALAQSLVLLRFTSHMGVQSLRSNGSVPGAFYVSSRGQFHVRRVALLSTSVRKPILTPFPERSALGQLADRLRA